MKPTAFKTAAAFCLALILSDTGIAETVAAASPAFVTAVRAELDLMNTVRETALRNDLQGADTKLAALTSPLLKRVPSVSLAQRAVQVCGTLRNEGHYGLAAKLAAKVVQRLSKMEEETEADRVERLYAEACLEAYFIDHKARAIELLKQAEAIAPDDGRIIDLELELVTAVNEFGR